jgi:uncharacterized protein (DUF486 family)
MQKIIETIVSIPAIYRTIFLLVCSNCFMTFAWYGHLKNMASKPWWLAAIVSWGIALFEYLLQVPANRIGSASLSLAQLKIMQEAITLTVFVPFSMFYMLFLAILTLLGNLLADVLYAVVDPRVRVA